ncbi:MAG: hypothetical protein J6C81_03060 [Muribaculaceae bacterium]|nr:hypothetical protein [Muribaculaceae bacterium]
MNKKLLSVVVGTSALLFSGCIDDAYDLSDIDTTSRVNVNGLVIPVNIDQITLDDIISFDENSKIKAVTIGGERFYALVENGEFNSEDIKSTRYMPTSLQFPHQTLHWSAHRFRIKNVSDVQFHNMPSHIISTNWEMNLHINPRILTNPSSVSRRRG